MGFLVEKNISILQILDCSLRLFSIPFSVATILLAVRNQQNNSEYGDLKFSNIIGFKYLVCISGISAGYAFVAAVSLWIKCLVSRAWLFFVSDQVVAYLLITSLAALWEIHYLAYNGDREVSWSKACSSYGKFCARLKVILALQIILFCCFFLLAIISAYRLFIRFESPFVPSNEVVGETSN